jgi:histidine kinase
VDASLEKLRIWAHHAPMNSGAKHALLAAERHRMLGEAEQARAEYYRAAGLAREHEYRNDEALIAERFASFLAERGEREVARLFLVKARHLYLLWGAEAKVRELDAAFPEVRAMGALGGGQMHASLLQVSTTSSTPEFPLASSQSLDLVSVIKASHAISGEVVLTELLKKLTRIMVENAGAQRGVLLLEGEHPLFAVAKNPGLDEEGLVTLHEDSELGTVEFSRGIMRYVERTHEVVVLGDASTSGGFLSDPYIVAHQSRSMLCMPILQQKKRVGILYLENELLANAFTPERCRVLELLAAQAAISLENAKLYDTLDTRVKERTRDLSEAVQRLQQTQKQLVLQEKLASLGSLTSGIAHEIKNPLNFVKNFAELTVSLASELREEFEREVPVSPSSAVPQLLGDLSQSATKILEHSLRADRIVQAMLAHARTGPSEIRPVDINELVHEHVQIAVAGRKPRGDTRGGPSIRTNYDESIGSVSLAPEEIGRVILNLINNSLYALDERRDKEGDRFIPALQVTTRDQGTQFEIRIWDNGCGIPAAVKDRIFSPFFTTKPPGEGTGLGLSISHDIVVQGHGGTMGFVSEEGASTEFLVVLPKRVQTE